MLMHAWLPAALRACVMRFMTPGPRCPRAPRPTGMRQRISFALAPSDRKERRLIPRRRIRQGRRQSALLSARGPDGIGYRFWAVEGSEAPASLLEVLLPMADGCAPPPGFSATMTFCPERGGGP